MLKRWGWELHHKSQFWNPSRCVSIQFILFLLRRSGRHLRRLLLLNGPLFVCGSGPDDWTRLTASCLFSPPLLSHSRLQPAAQDPELRGGPGPGPHQREDASPPRQQPARAATLPQQPARQHRTPGQERHQCAGLKKKKNPSSPLPPLPFLPSFLPYPRPPSVSFPPSLLPSSSPLRAGEERRRFSRSDSHHA